MAAIKLRWLAGLATVPGGGGSPAEGEVGVAVTRPLGELGALERVTGGPRHLWHGSVSMACKEGNRRELGISRPAKYIQIMVENKILDWTNLIKTQSEPCS